MATNWLSNLFKGNSNPYRSGGSVLSKGTNLLSASSQFANTPPTTKPQTNPRNAYAGRMEAMERFNRTRYNAVTGKYGVGQGSWRRPTTQEYANIPQRTGYANQYSRTQQEWLTQQNMRKLTGVQYPQMTQDEWIRRQRAAPVGYTYTPYAGWVPTPSAQGQTTPQPVDYGNQYGYGGGGGSGGGYGEGSAGSLPDWYNSFLSQVNWRI